MNAPSNVLKLIYLSDSQLDWPLNQLEQQLLRESKRLEEEGYDYEHSDRIFLHPKST